MTDPLIRLEQLTKTFPGQREAAVDDLTLDVPEGEIVVLVGPSGCGKTTIMRMVNRLIEPTSGRILLQGEDVTRADPVQLRRRMGYVIQQVGLFPHLTIEDNVALVPRMLGWDRARIDGRVDELLATVGLDPGEYRRRYPRELSGGQRQRVGVARAMAADPPVLLMDEPFGAIDPVVRAGLQDEFLRLQSEVRKTIVFVTHDIDEAVKMGDRIAVLRRGGRIAQYDRPADLLAAPADDFVAEFVGAGAALKGLHLERVRDARLDDGWPVVAAGTPREEVRAALARSDRSFALVVDGAGRPRRWVSARDLDRADRDLDRLGSQVSVVSPETTLHEALDRMLTSGAGAVAVVDGAGAYQGVVDIDTITAAIARMRTGARERGRAAAPLGSVR